MTWNHRVVFFKGLEGVLDDYYAIQEVYYENGKPIGYCDAEPAGESLTELKRCLTRMIDAIEQPVLNADELEGQSTEDTTND